MFPFISPRVNFTYLLARIYHLFPHLVVSTSFSLQLGQNLQTESEKPIEHTTFVRKYQGNFIFQWVDTDTILKTIQKLKTKFSMGVDGISNVLLKVIAPYIIKPLYKLLNRSFRTGTVPDSSKLPKLFLFIRVGTQSRRMSTQIIVQFHF